MELRNIPDNPPGVTFAESEIANLMPMPIEIKCPTDIAIGLCTTCDFLNACVWQHNNKIFCEHFQ